MKHADGYYVIHNTWREVDEGNIVVYDNKETAINYVNKINKADRHEYQVMTLWEYIKEVKSDAQQEGHNDGYNDAVDYYYNED